MSFTVEAHLKLIERVRLRIFNTIRDDDENDMPSNIFDTVIVSFIVLNVLIIILDTFDNIRPHIEFLYAYIEKISIVLFTVEYILRLWTSKYVYSHLPPKQATIKYFFSLKALIDLIALVPYYLLFTRVNLQMLRLFRLVRILNILKLNRYSRAIATIGRVLKSKITQLLSSLFIVILLIVFSSVLMYYVEHDAQPGVFDNAFSGVWWAIATLTTVGYGDIYPITILGKIIGTFIAMLGIGLVAVPTGIISAGFIEQIDRLKGVNSGKYCPHCGKKLKYVKRGKNRAHRGRK